MEHHLHVELEKNIPKLHNSNREAEKFLGRADWIRYANNRPRMREIQHGLMAPAHDVTRRDTQTRAVQTDRTRPSDRPGGLPGGLEIRPVEASTSIFATAREHETIRNERAASRASIAEMTRETPRRDGQQVSKPSSQRTTEDNVKAFRRRDQEPPRPPRDRTPPEPVGGVAGSMSTATDSTREIQRRKDARSIATTGATGVEIVDTKVRDRG